MGSVGYNAGSVDVFKVKDRLKSIEDKIGKKTNLTDKQIKELQDKLDNAKDYLDRTPEPDVMSNNQIEEYRELERYYSKIQDKLRGFKRKPNSHDEK